jgi:two-component system chemotaxis sensor kinase CheA
MDSQTFNLLPEERAIFFADVNTHLHAMEAGILQLEHQADLAAIETIFRAAHTLKALAGTIGHQRMVQLTHIFEALFEILRKDPQVISNAIATDLLAVVDALRGMRDEVLHNQSNHTDIEPLLARLEQIFEQLQRISTTAPTAAPKLTPEQCHMAYQAQRAGQNLFLIQLVANPQGFAPATQLYQSTLALLDTGLLIVASPEIEQLTHETTSFWGLIATPLSYEAIVDMAHQEDNQVTVRIERYDYTQALSPEPDALVRVSTERLDRLMNLVTKLSNEHMRLSELTKSLQNQLSQPNLLGELNNLNQHFEQSLNELQAEVLRTRLLPISSLLERLPRLVRDTTQLVNKQVDLHTSGTDIEVDRTLVDSLNEPLLHLIRNALDHGIEPPHKRIVLGKPKAGRLSLDVQATQTELQISLSDDGRGIDPQQIRQVAYEQGLITEQEAQHLDAQESLDLIFKAHLSTAERVTELSGRGIGLDAVRSQIAQLNGSIAVESTLGKGTTFRVRLPLSLSRQAVLLFAVAGVTLAVPLEYVLSIHTSVQGQASQASIDLSSTILPLQDLSDAYTPPRPSIPAEQPSALVQLGHATTQAQLEVDWIIGEQEVLINVAEGQHSHVQGALGDAVLQNGSKAVVLDVPILLQSSLIHQSNQRSI